MSFFSGNVDQIFSAVFYLYMFPVSQAGNLKCQVIIGGTHFFQQQARHFHEAFLKEKRNMEIGRREIRTGNARDMDIDTLIGAYHLEEIDIESPNLFKSVKWRGSWE